MSHYNKCVATLFCEIQTLENDRVDRVNCLLAGLHRRGRGPNKIHCVRKHVQHAVIFL